MTTVDLTRYGAVILDFDGPMCHVFAGYPAPRIADELRVALAGLGWPEGAIPTTSDPMQFLGVVQRRSPDDLPVIEGHLGGAELVAVDSGTETDGLWELLHHLDQAGLAVAVASNNHGPAIHRWLNRNGYSQAVRYVAGRVAHDPRLMKPHPHVLLDAAKALDVDPGRCCFVGDSLTDALAADAAGMAFVAMANKPHKHQVFTEHGCQVIVSRLAQLLPATVDH